MKGPGYVPLWLKSSYSFLEGASQVKELIEEAKTLQLEALALTDRHALYGAIEGLFEARKHDIKLILGAELKVSNGDFSHKLLLYAENKKGYQEICRLLTLGHAQREKADFFLSEDELLRGSPEGLLLCSLMPRVKGYKKAFLGPLAEQFKDRLYLGLPRHLEENEPYYERQILEAQKDHALPLLPLTEVLYHHPSRRPLQDVLTAIRHRKPLSDMTAHLKQNGEHALKSKEEMAALFLDHREALQESIAFSQRVSFGLDTIQEIYREELAVHHEEADLRLWRLGFEGAKMRYPEGLSSRHRAQLEKELKLIAEKGFSHYFLSVYEIVRFCKERKILCQGRGSAANSFLCYCLEITAIDPLKMQLLFERFLSQSRHEPPDIDLDIMHERREEVIQFLYARYGRDKAALLTTVVRFQKRSAMKELQMALGPSDEEKARTEVPLERLASAKETPVSSQLKRKEALFESLLKGMIGLPRHLSIHPGGMLLAADSLSKIVPLEPAKMEGRTVIQWDKYAIEKLGWFKIDVLALGALSHLSKAFAMLNAEKGWALSMAKLPHDDEEVFAMMGRGDCMGVFQIESRAQMAMIVQLKPQNLFDLTVEIALVRPGPMEGKMVHPYLKRRKGLEKVSYTHPSLRPILEKTYGVPIFQEQIMKMAMAVADYTGDEADALRSDMKSWKKENALLSHHHERWLSRMEEKGISREKGEALFQQVKGFGHYGFPESHAASFALIAYASAWFKCHHPAIFTCALLNAQPMGFYSPSSLIEDAKRKGQSFLPLSFWESTWDHRLEIAHGNAGEKAIRLGLRLLRNLKKEEAKRLIDFREEHGEELKGLSLKALMKRALWFGLSEESLRQLSIGGAFGGGAFAAPFGGGLLEKQASRREALWESLDKRKRDESLLALETEAYQLSFPGLTRDEEIAWDFQSMAASGRGHLLEKFRKRWSKMGYLKASQLKGHRGQEVHYVGMVIARQKPPSAKGTVFLSLEDESGMVNVIVWPKLAEQEAELIRNAPLLGVRARIQREGEGLQLIAKALWAPRFSAGRLPQSHDFH